MRFYSRATQIDEWEGQYPPRYTASAGVAYAKLIRENHRRPSS